MSEHLLEVKNLQTNFRTGGGIVQTVRGIDLHVDAGEFLGIICESGCGKSVSMMSILHLLEENAAVRAEEIHFNGIDLQTQNKKQIRKLLGSQIGKIVQIFGLAAVVDQNDVAEAVFQQAVDDGDQLLVRVKGGEHHGNPG